MPLASSLATLESSGLIRLAQSEPELEYLFRHGLTQEAAYGSLLKADRRVLHARVAENLERLYPDALDDLASTLAYHFRLAEKPAEAWRYFARAADHARALYAHAEAIVFYRAAIEQVAHTPEAASQTALLYEQLGTVLELTAQLPTAHAAYAEALSHLTAALDRARLQRKLGRIASLQHHYADAAHAYDLAEQTLGAEPSSPSEWHEWLSLNVERMEMHYWQGQLPELATLVERVRPVMLVHGTPALRAHFYDSLISVAERRNRYVIGDEILANARAMLAASQESGELRLQALAHFQMGFVLLWHNDFAEAEAHLRESEARLRRMGDAVYLVHVLTYLGIARRRQGDVESARVYIQQTLHAAQAVGLTLAVARVEANLSWLAWRAAQLDDAQRHGLTALELWSRVPFADPFQWLAHLPLLAVAVQHGQRDDAQRSARALLAPTQYHLPDPINDPLTEAIKAFGHNQPATAQTALQRALIAAEELNYL